MLSIQCFGGLSMVSPLTLTSLNVMHVYVLYIFLWNVYQIQFLNERRPATDLSAHTLLGLINSLGILHLNIPKTDLTRFGWYICLAREVGLDDMDKIKYHNTFDQIPWYLYCEIYYDIHKYIWVKANNWTADQASKFRKLQHFTITQPLKERLCQGKTLMTLQYPKSKFNLWYNTL